MDLARYIDECISIVGGFLFVLLSYRIIGKKPGVNLRADERHARFRLLYRAAGFVAIATGIVRLLMPQLPTPADIWRPVATTDGIVSVDMPGAAEFHSQDTDVEGDSVRTVQQKVRIRDGTFVFTINEMHFAENLPPENWGAMMDAFLAEAMVKTKGRIISRHDIVLDGIAGTEVKMDVSIGYRATMKAFLVGGTIYQVKVTAPDGAEDSADIRRFFQSLHVMKPPK